MKQRIITAILGIIIVAPIIIFGGWPFIITVYILATIALFEMMRMVKRDEFIMPFITSSLFLWLILMPGDDLVIGTYVMTKMNVIILFTILLLVMTVIRKNKFNFDDAAFLVLTVLFIGTAFYYLILTRTTGLNYFLFILFVIWSTDSGAYFIGRKFGKRKLWPEISPNKTIGGAIGGVFFAVILAVLFQLIYPFDMSLAFVIIIAIIISLVGQMGDLIASAIKRHYVIKDFGKIFPGHGGVLDRLDSLLFVLITLYVLQFF